MTIARGDAMFETRMKDRRAREREREKLLTTSHSWKNMRNTVVRSKFYFPVYSKSNTA